MSKPMTEALAKTYLTGIREYDVNDNLLTQLVEAVREGLIPALPVLEYFRKSAKVLKSADEMLLGMAEDEYYKYSDAERKGGLRFGDISIDARRTAGQYKHVDSLIIETEKRLKLLKELSKDAQQGKIAIDKETGQVIEPAEYSDGQMTLFVTVNK